MAGPVTIALIGAVGVVTGALVGALSGWWTARLTSQQAAKAAQSKRRREAYEAFLSVPQALKALHNSVTAVIFAGTNEAANASGAHRLSV